MASAGEIPRYFVESVNGWDREALEMGFSWLFDQARKDGESSVGLAVHSKQQIKELRPILGQIEASAIVKHGSITVNGFELILLLEKKLPWDFRDRPILAVWPRLGFASKLDDLSPSGLCAISWVTGELDPWKETWGATDLRTGVDTPLLQISNPVVTAGMRHLVEDCDDLRAPLDHPLDRGRAIGLFKLLRKGGEAFDPRQVAAHATRHGWSSSDAQPLQALAEAVQEGRQIRGSEDWGKGALKRLRSEAANTDDS